MLFETACLVTIFVVLLAASVDMRRWLDDHRYDGYTIRFEHGNGSFSERTIAHYDGTTKVIRFSPPFDVNTPDATMVYLIKSGDAQ